MTSGDGQKATHEDSPYWRLLGMQVVGVEPGRVRLRLPMQDTIRRQTDLATVHGGAIASLMDSAAASAVRSMRAADEPPWASGGTIDLNVSYLAPVTSEVTAEARVLRMGRSTAFVAIDVHDLAGALVATGRATFAIRRG